VSDPWDDAARQKTAASQQAAKEKARKDARERKEQQEERARQEAAHAALEAAIDATVPLLERFMRERGGAAQRLLAASGDRRYIYIGGESEGGYYHSYYLSKDGLCYEVGRKAGYGSKPDRATQASVRDVIASYAREGRGDRDPAKVRKIVDWLTEEVNRFA
jgi:hypothetical protein